MIEMTRIINAMKSYYDCYDAPSPLDKIVFEKLAQETYSQNRDPFYEKELTLIEKMVNDRQMIGEYNNLRNILKKMVDDANSKLIHKELYNNVQLLGLDTMQLYHGNMLFFHALRTSPQMHSEEQINSYIDLFKEIPVGHSLANLTVYSLIIQLYISLVYMRGDSIRDSLNRNTSRHMGSIQNIKRLFNHDIIRHLRNSLAHGHVRPAITGLYFKDQGYEIIIPLKIAEQLSQNLYGFYYLAFANLDPQLPRNNSIV